MHPILLLLAAASSPAEADEEIVITASREPVEEAEAAASVSVTKGETLAAIGLPMIGDALRLMPGVALATSGPPGSTVQLRIRGAEANHSLLFVDGIRFNDPAAANEARFELLTTDSLSRLELIRGPQSALWGSEALGGVVALTTADPREGNALSARGEYGSLDTARASIQGAHRAGDVGISGSAGWVRSDGIDAFDVNGEKDGFENRNASFKLLYLPTEATEIGLVGHWIDAQNDYDGFDPQTFSRADTLDTTDNRMLAGRAWLKTAFGADRSWSLQLDASHLRSRNLNALAGQPLNQTWGRRTTLGGQLSKQFDIGSTSHRVTAAIEYQKENFRARDQQFGGATNQDRTRTMFAGVAEWRADWSSAFSTDIAVRRDHFSDFADATTLRASLLFRPAPDWTLHAAYGEGIAQPTFFDLFGFFPGQYVGNPDLQTESGNSWEAGISWSHGPTRLGATVYRARLRDEIVTIFFPVTTAINANGKSRRWGIELEAAHRLTDRLEIGANYSFLDADEPDVGGAPLREVRRARHSANLVATARFQPVTIAATLGYVGKRLDTMEDFPFSRVMLDDYVLASLSVGWEIGRGIEAYARLENAFDADYREVFGYATRGRTVHAGLRLRLGD